MRLFEERGVWTEEMQAHNDALIARQEVLQATWENFIAAHADMERGEAFAEAWLAARAKGLSEAGLEVVFD